MERMRSGGVRGNRLFVGVLPFLALLVPMLAGTASAAGAPKIDMVPVKGGCFQMGALFSDEKQDEKPVHEVCVGDFLIGKYEVTQAQWQKVMGKNPSYFKKCGGNCPVEQVCWDDVQKFIEKLNKLSGKKYRLPTEAEWEYAARSGGKEEKFAGTGDEEELKEYAWIEANAGKKTHPVGKKKPNGLGLYDMSGNVLEWVSDRYDYEYYKHSPKDNPTGAENGTNYVLRSGSWSSKPKYQRTAYRYCLTGDSRFSFTGFRLALSPQ